MADRTDEDNGDYLGYSVYADTLWQRIDAALNKDVVHREAALREGKTPPPLGDDPLVVGLFGEWGAGKSKLLSLIQKLAEKQRKKQIEEHKFDGYKAITVPVFFQPWKYEHEKHLLVPLLLHILVELESTLAKARNGEDKATGTALALVEGTKNVLGSALKKVGDLTQAVGQVMGVADPIATAPMAAMVQMLAHGAGDLLAGKAKRRAAREFAHTDNGRSYYDMHRILSEVTRPAKNPHITGDQHHDKDFCINFVIFIDDLDRCLPEKAVETLELIKTVFNRESFAFVLALDEEVVERGIGHRYAAYTLAGKKPEMPITGFEYLEKIVHLPFRLPALSRRQAAEMLRTYESRVLAPGQPHLWWFAVESQTATTETAIPGSGASPAKGHARLALSSDETLGETRPDRGERRDEMELLPLVLDSFDAYVPRKLIRLVELLHQIAAVMRERQRPLSWRPGGFKDDQAVDVRVVLALLMLQLFQPELYRLMRRRAAAFPALLSAFAPSNQGQQRALVQAELADLDLYRWCACESELQEGEPLARIRLIADPADKAVAQQIRLPMVELLVQYRAAQRHPFDALKLMAALASRLHATGSGPESLTVGPYWSLLAPLDHSPGLARIAVVARGTGSDGTPDLPDHRARASGVSVQKLFDELASSQTEVQANLALSNGLELGMVLPSDTADQLLTMCQSATNEQKQRVTEGLSYLAPYLARSDGPKFAEWVATAPEQLFARKTAFENKADLAEAVAAADLRSALRLDRRFNPQRLYLPFNTSGQPESSEPIAGFVRVTAGPFTLGVKGKGFEDNPLNANASIDRDFYIARYLTTVDQYAFFIQGGGYEAVDGRKPDWWDALGWAWRTGQWDSQVKDKVYREHLARRTPELRGAPMNWAEQQVYGSRPVMLINWFEARAYARWLARQLGNELQERLPGYTVRLPTEAQWERAARARDATSADERQYPWGGADQQTVHLSANIDPSGIGRPSPVGLFAPNPLGLCDLSGNLWEWQNNLYQSGDKRQDKGLNANVNALKTHEEIRQCDLPALRGGAWLNAAENARASFRLRYRPDLWDDGVGFRVVLSLVE